jgi:hypothetical protein
MPLRRRKNEQRDPFSHLEGERQDAESGDPWYLTETTGELEVQAGISSNLRRDDLDASAGGEHPEPERPDD